MIEDLRLIQGYCLESLGLAYVAGCRPWNAVRKLPGLHGGGYGVALAWASGSPDDFAMSTLDTGRPLDVASMFRIQGWEALSGVVFFTYVQNLLHDTEEKIEEARAKFNEAKAKACMAVLAAVVAPPLDRRRRGAGVRWESRRGARRARAIAVRPFVRARGEDHPQTLPGGEAGPGRPPVPESRRAGQRVGASSGPGRPLVPRRQANRTGHEKRFRDRC